MRECCPKLRGQQGDLTEESDTQGSASELWEGVRCLRNKVWTKETGPMLREKFCRWNSQKEREQDAKGRKGVNYSKKVKKGKKRLMDLVIMSLRRTYYRG